MSGGQITKGVHTGVLPQTCRTQMTDTHLELMMVDTRFGVSGLCRVEEMYHKLVVMKSVNYTEEGGEVCM